MRQSGDYHHEIVNNRTQMEARILNEMQGLEDSVKRAGKNVEVELIQLHYRVSVRQEATPPVSPATDMNATVNKIMEGLAKKPRTEEFQ